MQWRIDVDGLYFNISLHELKMISCLQMEKRKCLEKTQVLWLPVES